MNQQIGHTNDCNNSKCRGSCGKLEKIYFVRTCQECGHRQSMKDPGTQKSEGWRDAKCRKCGSEALDYGSDGWIKQNGKFIIP